jgi:hypothetical protein
LNINAELENVELFTIGAVHVLEFYHPFAEGPWAVS